MKPTLISFYSSFYGDDFVRYFRRPSDSNNKKFKIQFTIKTPKNLYLHVHRNSGYHPCYIQTYDRGLLGNLKRDDPSKMIFDRAYFDFDVTDPQVHKIKKELIQLSAHGYNYKQLKQEKLREELRTFLIEKKIAKRAIDEVKDFAVNFKESFGNEPILFFSGCKGCHAYTFFEPIHNLNMNRTLSWFVKKVKEQFNYQTLDESVNKDAISRLSRVPYSKHQLTCLTVVPFTLDDSYDEILEKSLNPNVVTFNKKDYSSSLGEHLQLIDRVLAQNEKLEKKRETMAKDQTSSIKGHHVVEDHREWFKNILGEPNYISPNKPYVMYKCPFKDHEDNKPSFMVYPTGYKCKGCGKKGNYFQFLKDYNGWTDEEVKEHLNH